MSSPESPTMASLLESSSIGTSFPFMSFWTGRTFSDRPWKGSRKTPSAPKHYQMTHQQRLRLLETSLIIVFHQLGHEILCSLQGRLGLLQSLLGHLQSRMMLIDRVIQTYYPTMKTFGDPKSLISFWRATIRSKRVLFPSSISLLELST